LAVFEIAVIPDRRPSISYRFVKEVTVLHGIVKWLWVTPIGASSRPLLEGHLFIGRGRFGTRANVICERHRS
jgi:hypothetical protein